MAPEVAGDIARQMAAAGSLPSEKADKARKPSPFSVLGKPSFVLGDSKTYPRTTGFGNSRKPHPDGGTNETVAWVLFKPFAGLDGVSHEGRIYCERYVMDGKQMRTYSISLPFLKVERRDVAGRDAVESLKLSLRDSYREWVAMNKGQTHTVKVQSGAAWTESDEK